MSSSEIDDVDLICLDMAWGTLVQRELAEDPLYHDVSRKLIFAESRAQKGTTEEGL